MSELVLQPIVLSGGAGTRLWPLSREHYPKQLLALCGAHTLLQDTVRRMEGIALPQGATIDAPIVVCNEEHRFLVAEQLRTLGTTPKSILLEPVGRNTAPALTLAALASSAHDCDAVMLVMPADHVIKDLSAFRSAIQHGFALAAEGKLVTFGIVPSMSETGYGYIRKGAAKTANNTAFELAQFVEKPDRARAEEYLASRQYLWNSGIFMLRASVWLRALSQLQPEMAQACSRAYANGKVDQDFYRVDGLLFRSCPSDSIDYAVMEKVALPQSGFEAVVVPLDAGWSDVGAFPALWDIAPHDADGNALKGDIYAHQTKNSLIYAESRLVATVGLNDMIVIETADAVLVAHKDQAQFIKEIVTRLKKDGRSQYQIHRCVSRPWGTYEGIDVGERFQVKRITVNPRASLSLQMHHHRAEHWIVVRGTARVTRGNETFLVAENESTYIPLGVKHRLENPGKVPLELIEVQSGSYLGEDDIVRFDDVYGRDEPVNEK